ncbi:hypothetical protein BGX24_000777 [Mortierella sp. AD032]|nr:hypothetical protein BGX24_000777 [Mortierella sp. AD032]
MPDPLFHGSNARRPSLDRNQSSILTHPVGPSSNGLRTRNDHQQFSKPKTLTPRLLNTFDSPTMMATPPLSPTRQSAPCGTTQESSAQESSQGVRPSTTAAAAALEGSSPAKTYRSGSSNNGNGGHGNGGGHDRRRNQATARSRADSAPLTTRTVWPARPPVASTEPIVAVEPPRIPTQRQSSQAASAWNSLLTGVSPVRVNPRPVVRPLSRSNGSPSSNEHRRLQDVPIMLAPEREGRLTMEMYSLFETILPTEESHQRRTRLISKIEEIVETEWPGQDIRVLPFGSTINDLGTNTSDVDVCILTSWLGLQGVEMLAEVFRKHGMENVFCVPGARVPIVKLWDPELQLSCDMNINTQLGIMNSRMVKTYVAIDHRVRPFAMIIKHWARKRVLNDAANGGTISTYTWICMVINFLQMRSPPILPSLHDMPHELSPDNQVINGNNTSFFSDLSKLEGFGSANKESLGGLLYAFFRKFAIEFDYDHHVASVRHGCYLTKESKGWHLPGKHYRLLCVEEPFDTTRNLGNSCDMASSKGLKHEFKRALDILNHNGSLDQVCEQWIFPSSYYHNTNNNGYRNSNGNGQFSGNNTASLGRRYAAGYRSRSNARDTFDRNSNSSNHSSNNNGGGSDGSNGSPEGFRSIRTFNPSSSSSTFTNGSKNNVEGRQDRNGNERRPRSSSASVALTSSVPAVRLVETSLKSLKEDGVQLEKPLEDIPAAEPPKKESTTQSDTIGSHTGSNRHRRSSVHSSDSTSGSRSSAAKQGDKAKNISSPSSTTNSQRRSKPSGTKGNGSEGSKGNGNGNSNHGSGNNNGSNSSHSRQKNGRSGAGSHRESSSHGSKAPRATVELCLADIAKTTPHLFTNNKAEATLSDSSDAAASAGGGDTSEGADAAKKKKAGKKSLLWSTNSNRGESGANHHHHQSQQQHGHHRSSKPHDQGQNNIHDHNNQQPTHSTKTKTAVVPEAGPLVDSSETVPRS